MKRLLMCALLLGQGPALAQEEAVEEVPAEEAAAVEEVTAEEAATDEVTAEEVAGEAPADADAGAAEAYEGEYSGFVDVYYVPTAQYGAPGAGDAYADGVGGRGQFQFWKFLAVAGEYTTRTFDDDSKLDDQRLGIGAVARNGSGDTAGLFAQYERFEFEDGSVTDGYALHGRMSHAATEWFRFYADIGYQRLEGEVEKLSGFEFNAGLLFSYGPVGVFADWRRGQLEGKDSGDRPHLEDVRTGVRWTFGS